MRAATPAKLAELHEQLLYRRAYPASEDDARQADEELTHFPARLDALRAKGADLTSLEDYPVSGIAGSGMTAVFSYGVARHLAQRHAGGIRIAWEAWDTPDSLGRLLPAILPLAQEQALVEAHIPWERWLTAAARGRAPLPWLLRAIAKRWPDSQEAADRYDTLQLPLRWNFGAGAATRTLMRLPVKSLFCHTGPLLTRRDAPLADIPTAAPLPVRKLAHDAGEIVLALARDTSAVRYRELHGFTWGDPRSVHEIQLGRGVELFLSGVAPAHHLPVRGYHAMSIWKNGIPIGYFEGLTIQERMDAGFNLYYTFRAGETAWLYAQVLRACHQLLGVTCFVVDPYQLGHHNDEAIESGAFWFYRKLGFRSVSPEIRRLTEREERRLAARKGSRSPASTLRSLVREPMIYELPNSATGDWDDFLLERALLRLASRPRIPKSLSRAGLLRLGRP
jgi:hypothetical protein